MLYQLRTPFYKRDTYFTYSEKNKISDYFWLEECTAIDVANPLLYTVDKLDSYISSYDTLPTMGALLVSRRFKDSYQHLEKTEIQFIPVLIRDKKGNENSDYFCLNVLNKLPLLDFERSVYMPYGYDEDDLDCDYDLDDIEIMQAFYHTDKMSSFSIARMEENCQLIVVSENFVEISKKEKLKKVEFKPEGYHAPFTELGLEEGRKAMKKLYGK